MSETVKAQVAETFRLAGRPLIRSELIAAFRELYDGPDALEQFLRGDAAAVTQLVEAGVLERLGTREDPATGIECYEHRWVPPDERRVSGAAGAPCKGYKERYLRARELIGRLFASAFDDEVRAEAKKFWEETR